MPPSHATVAYRTVPGVARDLTSLDLYVPPKRCRQRKAVPVVVWVHGGGYRKGDKAQQVADKVALFAKRGWIFASVNYRLSRPAAGNARYPDHYDDVASAVAWLRKHVRGRGGDPKRIALLGHSAGADIVSNVAVNPAYLKRRGQSLRALRCFAPLDTAGFDKPRASPREQVQWRLALSNLPDYMTATSATLIAKRGTGIPPGPDGLPRHAAAPVDRDGVRDTATADRRADDPRRRAGLQPRAGEQPDRRPGRHRDDAAAREVPQILFRSSSFFPMTMRWISEVPSPISSSGASR